jgi:hypothetical protein
MTTGRIIAAAIGAVTSLFCLYTSSRKSGEGAFGWGVAGFVLAFAAVNAAAG